MKIGCVLVLYNPNWDITTRAIEAVLPQVDKVSIVDNSPESQESKIKEDGKIEYHFLNGNKGIAAAQNVGISSFIDQEYDYILFLDQDSIVESDLVPKLLAQVSKLQSNNVCIGAVGPRPVNRQQGKEYKGSVKKGIPYDGEVTEVTEIISSASLIPIDNFSKAGMMESELFIDGVDHEWCWRCHKTTGGRFFIVETAKLSHQLGEGDRRFLWKKVAIPTPFRTYYQFRNYFRLIPRSYVPLYWKLSNGLKYLIKLFYYPIFVSPRANYLINIYKGIRDGFRHRKQ